MTGIFLLVSILGCQPGGYETENVTSANPAAQGFNSEESDSLAIVWADATMAAMGGRKRWDQTRHISWIFFDRRHLIWDKHTGNVRIEVPGDSTIFLVNVHNNTGRVQYQGTEIMAPDSVANLVDEAKKIWINDSYWLVMPFKLKDTGVTLTYQGEGTTEDGSEAHILALTFDNVGVTPHNKYDVFITKSDTLVKQWSFYADAKQDSPSATWPWDNYKSYQGLLLSANRSDGKGPGDVQLYDSLPQAAFTTFAWSKE